MNKKRALATCKKCGLVFRHFKTKAEAKRAMGIHSRKTHYKGDK